MNDAPVRGYEEDVGNKTTMRFFYPESAFYNPGLDNEPDTLMVLVPFKQQDLRWLKEILYNEKRVLDVCENALSHMQTQTLLRTHSHLPFFRSLPSLPQLNTLCLVFKLVCLAYQEQLLKRFHLSSANTLQS